MKKMYLSKDGLTLKRVTKNSKGDIVIPEGVVYLAKRALAGCEYITEVFLPSTLKEIGEEAFEGCSSLKKITITEGVEKIPRSAFEDCTELAAISLPSTLKSIEKNAFAFCSSLTRIEIPDAVGTIGARAFYYCKSLAEVVMPAALRELGDKAFYVCSTLKEIDIPDGVETIPELCFGLCKNLTTAIFHEGLKCIEKSAFERCSIKHIDICSTIEEIGADAFFWNEPLSIVVDCANSKYCDMGCNVIMEKATGVIVYGTSSSTIPEQASVIRNGAFQRGPKMLVIPSSVRVIETAAFLNCDDGTTIIMSEGVTTIKWGAIQQQNGERVTVFLPSTASTIEGQYSTVEYRLDAANQFFRYDRLGHNIISNEGVLVWGHLLKGIPTEDVLWVDVINYGKIPYTELNVPDNVLAISDDICRLGYGLERLNIRKGTRLSMDVNGKTNCEISVTIPRKKSESGISKNTEYIIPKGASRSEIAEFLGNDSFV